MKPSKSSKGVGADDPTHQDSEEELLNFLGVGGEKGDSPTSGSPQASQSQSLFSPSSAPLNSSLKRSRSQRSDLDSAGSETGDTELSSKKPRSDAGSPPPKGSSSTAAPRSEGCNDAAGPGEGSTEAPTQGSTVEAPPKDSESTTRASSKKRPGASVSGGHKSQGESSLSGSQNADPPRSPAPMAVDIEQPVDSSADPQPGSRTPGPEGNTAHSPTKTNDNSTSDSDPRDDGFVPGENHSRKSRRRRRRSKKRNEAPSSKTKENPQPSSTQDKTGGGGGIKGARSGGTWGARGGRRGPPPSSFVSYPVVLTEVPGPSALSRLGPWERLGALEKVVGAVDSVRRLPSGKWLIGCSNEKQQNLLSRTNSMPGGIRFQAKMPIPTVEGVIGPIPLGEDALRRVKQDLSVKHRVAAVARLQMAGGAEGRAVKVTFEATELPLEVWIARTPFQVEPYAAPARRCTRCQYLGHFKAQCRSKVARCSNCGRGDHTAETCTELSSCINCCGRHSAAWKYCPEFVIRAKANILRSRTYMPYTQALEKARSDYYESDKSPRGPPGAGCQPDRPAHTQSSVRGSVGSTRRPPAAPGGRTYAAALDGRGQEVPPRSQGGTVETGPRQEEAAAGRSSQGAQTLQSHTPKNIEKNKKQQSGQRVTIANGTTLTANNSQGDISPRCNTNKKTLKNKSKVVGGDASARPLSGAGPSSGGPGVRSARRSLNKLLEEEAERGLRTNVPQDLRQAVFELFWAMAAVRQGKDPQVLLGVVARLLNWPQGEGRELRYSQTMDLMFVMAGLRDGLAPDSANLPLHF